jgi:hypothetical protein
VVEGRMDFNEVKRRNHIFNFSSHCVIVASCFFVLLWNCIPIQAQPSLKLNYGYLHCTEMDHIVQLYNSSRPWQSSPLVPITHGFGGGAAWNWRIQKSHEIHLLPEITYAGFFSKTTNFGKSISAGFHQASFNLTLRIHPKAIIKTVHGAGPLGTRFFLLAGGGYSAFFSRSKINGSRVEIENKSNRAQLSLSPEVRLGFGYHLSSIGRFIVTPELACSWIPSVALDGFTESVNGHNVTGISNVFRNAFVVNFGIRITMIGSQKNWWDRPREGDKT